MHAAVSDKPTANRKGNKGAKVKAKGKDKPKDGDAQAHGGGPEPHTRPEPHELLIDISTPDTPKPPPVPSANPLLGQIQPHNFAVVDHSGEPDPELLERLLREEEEKQLEHERLLHQQHLHHLENQPGHVLSYDPHSGPPPATNTFAYGELNSYGALDYGALGGYDGGYDDGYGGGDGYGANDAYAANDGYVVANDYVDPGGYGSSAGYSNGYVDPAQHQVHGHDTHVQPHDPALKHTLQVNVLADFKYKHVEDAAHDDVYTKLLGFSTISLVYRGLALITRYRELINRLDLAMFDEKLVKLEAVAEAKRMDELDPLFLIEQLERRIAREDYGCENDELVFGSYVRYLTETIHIIFIRYTLCFVSVSFH